MNVSPTRFNKEWTLFLDRDGVINQEIQGSYVTQWSEFHFYKGTLDALALLGQIFGHIVVVTNQRGVGRGIMSSSDLKQIHEYMQAEIHSAGGKIDQIYACTAVEDEDPNRKPNIGMALQAKQDIGDIDFKKSVMVGNNLSDMIFGKRMSMHTIFLTTTNPSIPMPHDMIDEQFSSLKDWADSLQYSLESVLN